jgi:prenyl protein peptidase
MSLHVEGFCTILQVLFQFLYTTVFGWYESALFLATGSIVPPILVHSFCNWIGVPDLHRMKQVAGGSVQLPLAITASGVIAFIIMLQPLLIRGLYSKFVM